MFVRHYETELATPDFVSLARAFGAEGHRVDDLDELPRALDKALGHGGPTLLELPIAIDPHWEL